MFIMTYLGKTFRLVIDEAQFIKNIDSVTHMACFAIPRELG